MYSILTQTHQIVAGIVGYYLNNYYQIRGWPQARWIYTEVIAGLSILFGLIWSIPFAAGFFAWPRTPASPRSLP
jgi:hypothetical protein